MRRLSERAAADAGALQGTLHTGVVVGSELEAVLTGEIDELAHSCGAPATAQGAWLLGTVVAIPDREPWAVVVRDGEGALHAAVVLLGADKSRVGDGGRGTVTLAGCAMGYRSAILADSRSAAALLGHGLTEVLVARGNRLRLQLGPVATDSPWLDDFTSTLRGAEILSTDPIPSVCRLAGSNADDYLSSAIRRTLRKADNRAHTDGRHLFAQCTKDAGEITSTLPEIERLHRERDHAQGRRSELDDVSGLRIWRSRLTALAAQGLLELSTLYIDGELASNVLSVVEPTTYRVLEGNLATRWARYAPGRVLEAAVLQRILDQPSVNSLDWMTAVAPDRLLAANDSQAVSIVRADYPHSKNS